MNYVIPILIFLLLAFSHFNNQNNYNNFVKGAKNALSLVFEIFANIVAIFVFIELFKASKISVALKWVLTPVFSILKIPTELCELIILKPFSGSGTLAILSDIYSTYGVDSYIGRSASVIVSSSETVFYVTSVYFSKTKVKNFSYAIPLALFVTILSCILACAFCRIF